MSEHETARQVAYKQHYQSFRALNQQMWQVPVLAMTLTGGIWFGAAKVEVGSGIQASLFILAALGNGAFIVTLWRVRAIIGQLLNKLEELYPELYVDASDKSNLWLRPRLMITAWTVVLALAAVLSLVMVAQS